VKNAEVVKRMVSYFYRADADYGKRLIAALKLNAAEVVGLANTLTVR